MKSTWRALFGGWLLLLVCAAAGAGPATAPRVLYVEEVVDATGISTLSARLGAVVNLTGASTVLGGQQQSVDAAVRAPAFTPAASYPSAQAAISAVRSAIDPGWPAVMQALGAQVRALGAQSGIYLYRVAVRLTNSAGTTDRSVVIRTVVRADGQAQTLGAKVTRTGESRLLYVHYEQRHVASILPTSFARQPAGDIEWQIFSSVGGVMTPTGTLMRVAAGGQYDEPDDPGYQNIDLDQDTGLRQLVQWTQQRMDELDADWALIDYGRTVEPVYDPMPDDTVMARATVNLPDRVFVIPPDMPSCPPPLMSPPPPSPPYFSQSGRVDYVLQFVTDRYFYTNGVLTNTGSTGSQEPATVDASRGRWLPWGTTPDGYATAVFNPVNNPPGYEDALYDANADPVHYLPPSRYVLGALRIIQLPTPACIEPPPAQKP